MAIPPKPPRHTHGVRYVPDLHDVDALVQTKVAELAELPSTSGVAGDYGAVRYLAQQPAGGEHLWMGRRCGKLFL